MYKIFIPTRGRPHKQPTYDFMRKAGLSPCLVCPPEEGPYHRSQGRMNLLYFSPEEGGLSKKRAMIMGHCLKNNIDVAAMIDDDVNFFVRKDPAAYNLRKLEPSELPALIKSVAALAADHGHAGIAVRQGINHLFPLRVKFATRSVLTLFIGTRQYYEAGGDFGRIPLMADFDNTLTMLRAGFPNAIRCDFACDHGSSNAPGGCSLYRTPELLTMASAMLHEFHPDFVKVVEKTTKTGWDGIGTRTDVRVQWRKAFASSGAILPEDVV